jgi:succinate dehydrogenase / fumarate reductase cytochrome b subunit
MNATGPAGGLQRAWGLVNEYRREVLLNPHCGMWLFLFQRITGIGLVVYLLMHIAVIGSIGRGPQAFDRMMDRVTEPRWVIGPLEMVLFVALLLHAANGIRIAVIEFSPVARYYRASVVVMTVVALPALVLGVLALLRWMGG